MRLGEDNEYVYKQVLRISDEEHSDWTGRATSAWTWTRALHEARRLQEEVAADPFYMPIDEPPPLGPGSFSA